MTGRPSHASCFSRLVVMRFSSRKNTIIYSKPTLICMHIWAGGRGDGVVAVRGEKNKKYIYIK